MLLVADVVENEITDLATHIWPCQGQLERSDVNPLMEIYRIAVAGQYTPAVMSSEGDRSPLWWWYAKLAEQLDLTFFPNRFRLPPQSIHKFRCSAEPELRLVAARRIEAREPA